jgi:hypothetical protein
MMWKGAGLVVRRIIIAEQELSCGILAMIAVLGFHQPQFGSDEFHDENQQTSVSFNNARALVSSWYVSHSPAHSMTLSSSPMVPA